MGFGKARVSEDVRRRISAFSFLAAPVLLYSTFVIGPVIYSFFLSFTDWNGASPTYNFVGLENFRMAFRSEYFWNALRNNAVWTIIFIAFPTALGLFLAKMVDGVRGENVFKTIIYLPMTFSFVIVGLIWSWIYLPESGMINLALKAVGLGFLKRAWLAEPRTVLYAIIVAASWQQTGFAMVLFLAGLRGIPREFLEASQVDGANGWQQFWKVVFPLLKPTTTIVISITVINSLRIFDIVYIMTQGGPNRASEVLGNMIYKELFWNFRVGYGSALSLILFMLILAIIAFYLRTMLRKEVEY